jgi:hypothetical protein
MRSRLNQILMIVLLMGSLLAGSAAACMCSHHEAEPKAVESSCHGPHEQPADEAANDTKNGAFEVDCQCLVKSATPLAVSKTERKKYRSEKDSSATPLSLADLSLPAPASISSSPPKFEIELSHSTVLRSLLPARAPPRL